MTEPDATHEPAAIRKGGDGRVFNGEVPPWPEAAEAQAVGQTLAAQLGVPFRFESPDGPTD